jgi:hypothetical protein
MKTYYIVGKLSERSFRGRPASAYERKPMAIRPDRPVTEAEQNRLIQECMNSLSDAAAMIFERVMRERAEMLRELSRLKNAKEQHG